MEITPGRCSKRVLWVEEDHSNAVDGSWCVQYVTVNRFVNILANELTKLIHGKFY